MTMSPKQIQDFQAALLDAFRNKSSLEQMVFFGMGEKLSNLVTDAPLNVMVFKLIEWADENGRVEDLLNAARQANSGNPVLRQFAQNWPSTQASGTQNTGTTTSGGQSNIGAVSTSPTNPQTPPTPAASEQGAVVNGGSNQGAMTNPVLVPGQTADPPPIRIEDKDRLRIIIQTVIDQFLPNPLDRRGLLSAAGMSAAWLANLNLGGAATLVAQDLLDKATTQGFPLQEGRRGYTILGAILDQILTRELVGLTDGQYLASTISRYRLIDFTRQNIQVSSLLQALMQFVPQMTGEAEAAVRALLNFDQYLDAGWLDQGAAACRAVCRVETPYQWGTGFLVGRDLVLTNHHVMKEILANPSQAGKVVLRFGYKRRPDGTVDNGDAYGLATTNWAVDSSPNEPGKLDYALLRLADPAGSDAVGDQKRGWLKPAAHQFVRGEDLYIIQHPLFAQQNPAETQPMKVVLAPNAVDQASTDGSRVTYATNTEHGSSGSPCFTRNWELVALHHSGLTSTLNEGIPLAAVSAQPLVKTALGL